MSHYIDVAVLGAGSGGLTAAVGLAKAGKRVLLIEKDHLGGECTNSGCIPSKALLHHATTYATAVRISGVTRQNEIYRQEALEYVRSTIAAVLKEETSDHFEKIGITVRMGEAIFTGKTSLIVAGDTYHFKKAVIATGSLPRPLTIPGLAREAKLTNQNLFTLDTIPARTLIVGAGPIGMEMGQALALLGSKVTIINNGPIFARLEDTAIQPLILKRFLDLGITILNSAEVQRVEETDAIIKTDAVHPVRVPFDKVLIAVGRIPQMPQGLAAANVDVTEYGITVNHRAQTSNRHIYALGDVASPLKFTHVADDTARQVVAHIISYGFLKPKKKHVPKVTYTDPEIAQVGLSWDEAVAQYGEEAIRRIEVPLSANDRARTDDAMDGILIVIARRLRGTIIGAHMMGPRAGELIGTLTLAMEHNISLYKLRSTIFAYPTYSLILKRAGDYFLAAQLASLRSDLRRELAEWAPKIIAALLWFTAIWFFREYQEANDLTSSLLALHLFTFISTTVWGPLLYMLAYTIRPLTFFPGTALTILSGVFFGLWGILYTIIGANLSAALAYGVGRFFSTPSPDATSLLTRFSTPLRTHPFSTILMMRLTFFPFDLVNYGAGFLRTPFAPYILATIIGTILGIATFVSIGASLSVEEFIANGITPDAIDSTFFILSGVIFVASLLLAKLIQRHRQKAT